MVFRANGIEYCHWQTSYSSYLEVVIIFSFLGEGSGVFYRWSPVISFPASSSTVVSWLPTTFLPLVGPWRTATIYGFSNATLPSEAVTMSPRVTLVVSKFSLPIEAVTTNMHPSFLFSLVGWGEGAG